MDWILFASEWTIKVNKDCVHRNAAPIGKRDQRIEKEFTIDFLAEDFFCRNIVFENKNVGICYLSLFILKLNFDL